MSKLTRNIKLLPKGTKYQYKRYNRESSSIERPNLLNQIFQTDGRNKIGVGDITCAPTKKGVLVFSCISRYLFTQSIWIAHGQENEEQPCNGCIHAGQAYGSEHPDKGLIVHTGQDSQFTGGNFRTLLHTRSYVKC